MAKKKILHIELEEPLNSKFDMVKEHLGLKNDGEVVRFLLTDYFNHHLKKELEGKERRRSNSIFRKLVQH